MAIFQKSNNANPRKNGNVTVGGPKVPLFGDSTFRYEENTNNWYNEHSKSTIVEDYVSVPTGQEKVYKLPDGTTHIEFQNREDQDLRYSFVSGHAYSQTEPYSTLKAGYTYYNEFEPFFNAYLFFGASVSGRVEIRTW